MNNHPAIELVSISRFYGKKDTRLDILKDVNFALKKGEITALVGPSGSGKSTLLHITGLLDQPSGGQIFVGGKDVSSASDKERTFLRRKEIGFVYQYHLLLPDFNALENVMLPQLINGQNEKKAKARAEELLDLVGLKHRLKHRSGELSGGEQQRVAIARALANEPNVLLADEPTGNLDPKTAEGVFQTLLKLVKEKNLSALIATHNPELALQMDRQISVDNGMIKEG